MRTSKGDPAAQSVHDRLKNLAKERREDFNALLARYANERFLYRLSRTHHAKRFVLKGAMLFVMWLKRLHRPTRDLDLLGSGEITEGSMRAVFADVCSVRVEADGLSFDPASIVAQEIRENQVYQGVRVKIRGGLGNARVDIQVDVGIGDAVTPRAIESDFPTLLDLPAPRLKTYPIETVVAEKLEAMLALGLRNSRMKDFLDLWLIARNFTIDGVVLSEAVRRTCERRRTPPETQPACFTGEFAQDASKQIQWSAFIRRGHLADVPATFSDTMETIRTFLHPIAISLVGGESFDMHWPSGGPWQRRA